MTDRATNDEEDTRRLVVAITDFLRDQLIARTELVPEDRDCLEIAIQCLEMAYGLEAGGYVQFRFSRPLLDIFNQVTNPVSVKNKLKADTHKDEGNSYMRRSEFANAETEYTHAIELDRWNAVYYCNRASSRIEQRNFFEAISDCRQALMLNPDYAKAHARMGQAYALIHRPREAARSFRQALDLEPGNERYRNNLRVAESQINRPDAVNLITTLLGSLFGARPDSGGGTRGGTAMMPPSFMIITESHPPTQDQPPQSSPPTENSANRSETTRDPSTEGSNITYPLPFGVMNEGSAEQPIFQIDIPIGNIRTAADSEGSDEFDMEFPSFSYFEGAEPDTRTNDNTAETTRQDEGTDARENGPAGVDLPLLEVKQTIEALLSETSLQRGTEEQGPVNSNRPESDAGPADADLPLLEVKETVEALVSETSLDRKEPASDNVEPTGNAQVSSPLSSQKSNNTEKSTPEKGMCSGQAEDKMAEEID